MDRFFNRIYEEVEKLRKDINSYLSMNNTGCVTHHYCIRIPVFKDIKFPKNKYNIKHSGIHSKNIKSRQIGFKQLYSITIDDFNVERFMELFRKQFSKKLVDKYKLLCGLSGELSKKQRFAEYIPEYSFHFKVSHFYGEKYYTCIIRYNINCHTKTFTITIPLAPEGWWYTNNPRKI